MKFFQSVTTIEELKKQYRKLALKFHPDKGGNPQDFIQLKEEYDQLFKQLNKTDELKDTFRNIIDSLIKYDIEIEIIGTWVWITGNTYAIKSKLNELGFKWARKKKAWYWHEGEYKKVNKKQFTLDDIRNMHKVQIIKTRSMKMALEA